MRWFYCQLLFEVWDEQGKTDTSRVSFTVLEDLARKSAVDLVLDRELARFTHAELKVSILLLQVFLLIGKEAEGKYQCCGAEIIFFRLHRCL